MPKLSKLEDFHQTALARGQQGQQLQICPNAPQAHFDAKKNGRLEKIKAETDSLSLSK